MIILILIELKNSLNVFTAIFLLFLINKSIAQDDLIRQTNNGLVKGRISNDIIFWLGIYIKQILFILFKSKNLNYKGFPLAEPPINDLRFKRPIPKNNWTGILNATTTPPMCVQKDQLNSKEDCLYLNVLAPRNITSSSSLPVMVYIHGEGLRYI